MITEQKGPISNATFLPHHKLHHVIYSFGTEDVSPKTCYSHSGLSWVSSFPPDNSLSTGIRHITPFSLSSALQLLFFIILSPINLSQGLYRNQ
jgi:hypothetical protein